MNKCTKSPETISEIERLRNSHAQLVAALETMVAEAGRCGWDVDRARAALASAKEGQQ